MLSILRGIGISPEYVAAARGVVEAAVLAGLAYVALVLPEFIEAESLWLAVGYAVIRTLEGYADKIDPAK